jgi:uncharacterized SAM-binding protein YcdF (DUF218 family)
MKTKIVRLLFIIFGIVFILNSALVGVSSNFTTGVILEFLLGAVCVSMGALYDKIKKPLKITVYTGLAIVLCACVSLWIYGAHDTADYNEDVLIVLGAGVHGYTPTEPLRKRLDSTLEYMNENKNAYVIVSGGQGPQEKIMEAWAMGVYLIERGADADKIILEGKATSTSENFSYSKEIIDKQFPNAKIAVLTNDFHIYRAKRLAKLSGLDVTTVHAETPLNGRVSTYLRELLAVVKLWVLKS